ncbi:Ubiquitin carboxyl-terminal hydrolase 13 [Glycine soja]
MAWVLLDGEFCPKKFQFFRTSTFHGYLRFNIFSPKFQFICVSALLQLLFGCRAIKRRDIYGAWEQYLGLKHDDSAPKKSYAVNQEINCCFVEWMCKLWCNISKKVTLFSFILLLYVWFLWVP